MLGPPHTGGIMLKKLVAKEVDPATLEPIINEIKRRILRASDPEIIYLFGSLVRGDFRDSSDIDIALIFKTTEEAKLAKEKILPLKPIAEYPVDYLFIDMDSFIRKREVGGVWFLIHHEGRIIHRRTDGQARKEV